VASDPLSGIGTSSNPLTIGAVWETDYNYFNGSIDEVMIFNRSLSADEVKSLYYTSSTDHRNDGDGLDYTESTTGEQTLTTFNSTHLQASDFVIPTTSDYLLTDIGFDSDGFYSGVLEDVQLDTYEDGGVEDTEYPLFSNFWDNNATLIDSGTALFNSTITHTNGTVFLEIDGTNYTATNLSDVYNASASLTSGTYDYYWHSWGNGTSNNYNNSGVRSYTVNTSGDSCSCPSVDTNWEIDLEDYCFISSNCNIGTGNISFIKKGYLTNIANINIGGTC